MRTSAKILGAVLALLLVATLGIWYAAFYEDHRGKLTVTVFPNGVVFIKTSSGRNIVVNGGQDDSILRELGVVMPFYERSIDLVIAADLSPDKVGGLTDVLGRYAVDMVARSPARSSAPQAQAFTAAVSTAQQHSARLVILDRAKVLDLRDGTYIQVFFPDREASSLPAAEGCVMFKLIFGATSFFFSCGSAALEQYLASLDGTKLRSDVLIATGDEPELFLGFVSPGSSTVPCGSNASSTFAALNIYVISSCGGVSFVSDGQTVARQ